MKRKPRYAAIYEAFEHAVALAHAPRPPAGLKYRKVGNVVHITGRINPDAWREAITRLPFWLKAKR